MPKGISNRIANNWRPVIAVADLFGEDWGQRVRDIAIRMSKGSDEDDRKIQLLWDFRKIFDNIKLPSIGSAALVQGLCELPDATQPDNPYIEWRGVSGDGPSRRLTPHMLADVLHGFGLKRRTVWPHGNSLPARHALDGA
jgi:hypothetical protein